MESHPAFCLEELGKELSSTGETESGALGPQCGCNKAECSLYTGVLLEHSVDTEPLVYTVLQCDT